MAYQVTKSKFTAQLLTRPNATLIDINAFLGLNSTQILAVDYAVVDGEIFNVLTTTIGDEEFEPTYGSLIPNRLFDPSDDATEQNIRTDLFLALAKWVPYIEVDLSATTVISQDRGWNLTIAWIDKLSRSNALTSINFRR